MPIEFLREAWSVRFAKQDEPGVTTRVLASADRQGLLLVESLPDKTSRAREVTFTREPRRSSAIAGALRDVVAMDGAVRVSTDACTRQLVLATMDWAAEVGPAGRPVVSAGPGERGDALGTDHAGHAVVFMDEAEGRRARLELRDPVTSKVLAGVAMPSGYLLRGLLLPGAVVAFRMGLVRVDRVLVVSWTGSPGEPRIPDARVQARSR